VGFVLGPNGYPEAPLASIHPNNLQAMLAYTESYQYDPVGNLLQTLHQAAGAGWTRTQTYLPGTNRLNTVSVPGDPASGPYSGVHRHDAAGNIVQMPNLATMTWDHAGRLVSASLGGGGTAYFVYDAAGNRVRKVIARSGQFLDRVYVGEFERYRELAGTALPTATVTLERQSLHVHDGERRFALLETNTVDTSVANFTVSTLQRFQFPNHLGSACLETDPTGSPISYEEYYPFGGSSFRSGDSNKRYRFASKERDEETGLYFFGARYYAPWIARWASCDPKWPKGVPNLYIYALNNPVLNIDLDGMEPEGYYELPGRPGNQWFGYFLGTAAHTAIAYKYAGDRFPDPVLSNRVTLRSVLERTGLGDPSKLPPGTERKMADIVNPATREVYEIKPGLERADQAEQQKIGQTQLTGYLDALNAAARPGVRFVAGQENVHGELGVRFAEGVSPWRLRWATTTPGVIQYRWERLNLKDQSNEAVREAYAKGDWVEVPAGEVRQHEQAVLDSVNNSVALGEAHGDVTIGAAAPIVLIGQFVTAFLGQMILGMMGGRGASTATPNGASQGPGGQVIPFRPAAPPPAPAVQPEQVLRPTGSD
jgi:RHS repeat-associated protein